MPAARRWPRRPRSRCPHPAARRRSSLTPSSSERDDVDRLAVGRAAGDGVGELHVAPPVLERGPRDLLAPADGADELLLDPPADALLGRYGDLLQLLVAALPARQPPGLRLQPQRALAAEDPEVAGRGQPGDAAEPQVGHGAVLEVGGGFGWGGPLPPPATPRRSPCAAAPPSSSSRSPGGPGRASAESP